jgi:hypothetical protein
MEPYELVVLLDHDRDDREDEADATGNVAEETADVGGYAEFGLVVAHGAGILAKIFRAIFCLSSRR